MSPILQDLFEHYMLTLQISTMLTQHHVFWAVLCDLYFLVGVIASLVAQDLRKPYRLCRWLVRWKQIRAYSLNRTGVLPIDVENIVIKRK